MHRTKINAHFLGRPVEFSGLQKILISRFLRTRWAWLPTLVFWTLAVPAAGPAAESLEVVNAWSRATPPGISIGVAYFEIVNWGDRDVLEHLETPIARQAQMHSMRTVAGVMQMRELGSVDIPARGRVRFEPNNLHVMLIDLIHPLKKRDRFPLTLVFQHAGAVQVEVIVQDLGAMSAPGASDPS